MEGATFLSWMAWTWPTAAFFLFILLCLTGMSVWEYYSPGGDPRHGILGLDTTRGDRLFIGCQDGYVYEMNRGTSFDGAPIESYIRLPFNFAKSPSQHTRWMKATFELSTPDAITVGMAFDIDYAKGYGGLNTAVPVDAGSAIIATSEMAMYQVKARAS